MNKKLIIIVSALAVPMVLFLSCATAPKPRQFQSVYQFNYSFDEVWAATLGSLADIQLALASTDKASGVIMTEWTSGVGSNKDGFCDCGSSGIMIEQSRRGKFTIFVKRLDDNVTEVRSTAVFEQVLDAAGTKFTRVCQSSGRFETRLPVHIQEHLK